MKRRTISGTAKTLSIVGLVMGILALPLATIDFFGFYAIVLGAIAIFFSLFAYVFQKNQRKKWVKIPLLGGIIGLSAFSLSLFQYFKHQPIFDFKKDASSLAKGALIEKAKDKVLGKTTNDTTLTASSSVPNDLQTQPIEPPQKTTPSETYVFSITDKLRIRKTPNLKGEILGHLDYGETAINLAEESGEKESINLAGARRHDNWKKIKFRDNNFQDYKIGWVYGGGLVHPANGYHKNSAKEYFKIINNASLEEVQSELDMEIFEPYTYNGLIKYQQSENGDYFKQGEFYIAGKSEKGVTDLYDFQNEVHYKGSYQENRMDGTLEKFKVGYENSHRINIKYKDGNCIWFSLKTSAEGEESATEEKNPKDCSNEYIWAHLEKSQRVN